jgi:hypothetical protein
MMHAHKQKWYYNRKINVMLSDFSLARAQQFLNLNNNGEGKIGIKNTD